MDPETLEKVLLVGDLSRLSPAERVRYYLSVCRRLDLDPTTRPFEYLVLQNKMTLYARKDCTEQLRAKRGISLTVASRSKDAEAGVYIVEVKATLPDGRVDFGTGAVPIKDDKGGWLKPTDLANAAMKAETKAKRRATLSICGLGFLDESELETIPARAKVEAKPLTEGQLAKLAELRAKKPEAMERNLKLYKVERIDQLNGFEADHVIGLLEEID